MAVNMSLVKNKVLAQNAVYRSKNFLEVTFGYSKEQAIDEANRCLGCKNKLCVTGCPVQINIPDFIKEVSEDHLEEAYRIITCASSLPAVCGRVCPQESQCEAKCVRGIKGEPVAIGRLERFVADYHNANCKDTIVKPKSNGHKVAVIGSGPSGLACAGDLAKKGYQVTIYEALHIAGGVLVYGIPEFRLPKAIVQKEINVLKELGVKIEINIVVGKTISIDELLEEYGYESVYIGSGAGLPKFMNIKGENLKGVYSANEFLTRINLMKAYENNVATPIQRGSRVAVIGGGNVAMDAARCAKRLGAEVTVIYRRTEKELPARLEEVEHAKEEGIEFMFLTNPLEIRGTEEGWINYLVCEEMMLGEPDSSGRQKPISIQNSEFYVKADCVIMSIGTSPNPLIKDSTKGLSTLKWGGIIADETTGLTSRMGVYAGGDAVTGAATVILAMGAGKNAAAAIDEYITEGRYESI
jgi:glutamate synthase (NADPH) small chain